MKKETPPEKTTPEPTKKRDYLTLRIPRFNFQNTSINAFLVIALVIFSFFLGMLTNKVIYLEKVAQTGTGTTAVADSQITGAPTAVPPPQIVAVTNGKLPILGDQNAKVSIVEFSDFECPFCKKYIDDTMTELKEKYVDTGKATFAYRHSPLTVIHPNAKAAAIASECAQEQDGFWPYHDLLFEEQASWSQTSGDDATAAFVELAGNAGLDTTTFSTCLESDAAQARVDADMKDAEAAQVDGTPTFFINGYRVVGAVPFSELEKVIEDELKK